MNPFVFIVGCPRSGTTLLQRMVDAHPSIAITPETHWIAKCVDDGLVPDGVVTQALLDHLIEVHKFRRLGFDRPQIDALMAADPGMSYAMFVRTIFDLYGRRQGKEIVGDKTPRYVRNIPTLHALFPETRFVHIIRDGRDVALSLMDWPRSPQNVGRWFPIWREDPTSAAAAFWEWSVRLGREAGLRLGPDLYLEVRYEVLVDRPAETAADVCRFLGLPFDDGMVRFHEGRTRSEPGLDAKHAWLPVTAGLRDWRRRMHREDVARFEAVAGGLLGELGYARSSEQRPGRSALGQSMMFSMPSSRPSRTSESGGDAGRVS